MIDGLVKAGILVNLLTVHLTQEAHHRNKCKNNMEDIFLMPLAVLLVVTTQALPPLVFHLIIQEDY